MFLSAILFAASTVIAVPTTTPVAKQQIRSAIGDVLQGRGTVARSKLQSISPTALDAKDRAFRECALARLDTNAPLSPNSDIPTGDVFARAVLNLYRTYWRASALSEANPSAAEKALVAGLTRLLGRPLADVSAAEPLIAARLKASGLFSQQGQTGVLYDLMIWKQETHKVQQVRLPEGSNATQVSYLDGFISRGWSSYFTCNRAGTGGWTTDEGLFVIVPNYESLTDENFRVNFLAHESQHYADMKRYGDLPSWRLEYRAKLVEVAYADTTIGKVLNRAGFAGGSNS